MRENTGKVVDTHPLHLAVEIPDQTVYDLRINIGVGSG
jgi:hypothetical protein